jgi:hypothetical protein
MSSRPEENRPSRRGLLRGAFTLAAALGALPLPLSEAEAGPDGFYPATGERPADFDFQKQSAALQPDQIIDSACQFCNSLCRLKVHLKQGRIIDVRGEPDDRDWPVGVFDPWTKQVRSVAQGFWNKKFWLKNATDYSGLDVRVGGAVVHPNVECCLEIALVDSSRYAHAVINCFNPDNAIWGATFVRPDDRGNGTGQFNRQDVDLSHNFIPNGQTVTSLELVGDPLKGNLAPVTRQIPKAVDQFGVAHEVGHLLGLPHVGVARRGHDCLKAMQDDPRKGQNAPACYLGDTVADAENIMGKGNTVAPWNALPWQIRLFKHTGLAPDGWPVTNREPPPVVL